MARSFPPPWSSRPRSAGTRRSSCPSSTVFAAGAAPKLEPPDRALAVLGGHDGPAVARAVLVDHQVPVADADVVGADGGVAAARDHLVGVVDDGQSPRLRRVARVQAKGGQ